MVRRTTLSRRSFFGRAGSALAAATALGPLGLFTKACGRAIGGEQTEAVEKVRWTAGADRMDFRYDYVKSRDQFTLYRATPETGMYAHHPYITKYRGTLFAAWDTQMRDEGGSGQSSSYRWSNDRGQTWSEIKVLIPPMDENVPASQKFIGSRIQKFNGFVEIDEQLYALADVADWAGPSIGDRYAVSVGLVARKLNSDGTTGEIFWLTDDPPEPVKGFPAYPGGDPTLVTKMREHLNLPGNGLQLEFKPGHPHSNDNHRLSEPTSYMLENKTWVRLYRDGGIKNPSNGKEREASKSRRLYASFNRGSGRGWTTPTRTSFPDVCARPNAGVLPDGKRYVINNVLPLSTKYGGRILLAISLSDDGLNFDRTAMIRFNPPPKRDHEGRAKAIGYQYPHSVVVGDELLVIYSINKEDIELTRIPLKELDRLPYYDHEV